MFIAKDLVKKNCIFGSLWQKFLIQMAKYSFPDERIVYQSFYSAPLTVCYFYLSSGCVFRHAFPSHLLGLYFIFQLCLLREHGIVEVCIPGSI